MRRRALVVSNDHVGKTMAGPGIRSYHFAVELARDFDVTLVVPFETDLEGVPFEVVHDNPWDPAPMSALVGRYDVVVTQHLPVTTMRTLARLPTRVIYDLYSPATLEQLPYDAREEQSPYRTAMAQLNSLVQEVALATGDAFVCASEKQRDFWLGALASARRLDRASYEQDPSLRALIDVVPFGIDPEPPQPGPALRGVVPGIGADDKILLWPGGIWNWFDPLTVIRAVDQIARRRKDVRLYFLGVKHPNPEIPDMTMASEAVTLADELGLRDRIVFFNFGWVPYTERGRYLLEADLAVSAHFDDIETQFAFRTRFLDCLWAGLPIVTTQGDTLGELIVAGGAGSSVAVGDVDGWVEALETLLDDASTQQRARLAAAAIRPSLEWPRVVGPLRHLAEPGITRTRRMRVGRSAEIEYLWLRVRIGLARHGLPGTARRIFSRVSGAARRTLRWRSGAPVP